MKTKSVIGFALASFLLFGGLTTLAVTNQNNNIIEEAEAWSLDVQPNVQTSYYSTCEGKTGSSLVSALAAINKPVNKSYSWSRYEAADEAQNDSTSILSIYTRHNIKKSGHVGSSYAWDLWNREHVYTQTAFPNSDDDNHNIFACEGKINGIRGNKKFAEGGSRVTVFDHQTDCYTTGDTFEPCDEAKGEIARACMYCTIYYGYTLPQIFDSVATAIKWHAEHPVTPREIYRNNVVYGLQGNRNPFVDHPSYANAIWGANYTAGDPLGGDVITPTPVQQYTVTFNSDGGSNVPSQTVNEGATASKPTNPTKDGFTFLGWFLEGSSSIYDFSTPVTSDITLVAHWSEKVDPQPVSSNHGLSQDDPLSPAEAIALCDEAGAGNIVGVDKQYYVKGVFDEGTTINTKYSQWYGMLSGTQFKVSGATNDSGVAISETDGAMDNKEVIIKGFIELYNNEYKIGYLPANASPTGEKFVPSIISVKDKTVEPDPVSPDQPDSPDPVSPDEPTNPEPEQPTTNEPEVETPTKRVNGCGGSLIASSAIISLTSLLGLGLLLIKKKY